MALRHNPEVGVQETVSFVLEHLEAGARVLDAGCGAGEVAGALAAAGLDVVAIDPDREAVTAAAGRGLDARESELLDFDGEGDSFDAVLLSRSLHHMPDVGDALARAGSLVRPKGVVLLEEFAIESVDLATALWHYGVIDLLARCGRMEVEQGAPRDVMERWHHEHRHEGDLHTGAAMSRELHDRFRVELERRGPYLFRRIAAELEPVAGTEACRHVLEWERRLIEAGSIRPVGWRAVARKR